MDRSRQSHDPLSHSILIALKKNIAQDTHRRLASNRDSSLSVNQPDSRLSHHRTLHHTRVPSLVKGALTMPVPTKEEQITSMVRRLPEAKKTSLVKILNHRDVRLPQRLEPVDVRNTQYRFTIDTFQD